jgi:hypothetical protein
VIFSNQFFNFYFAKALDTGSKPFFRAITGKPKAILPKFCIGLVRKWRLK